MRHCSSCAYRLPRDREQLGARCPQCRAPLYEPPESISRPARAGEGGCALHAGQEAVGTCGRCGNYYCEVCRTRWRGQILCTACVERALAVREATPEQVRAHFRQALLGLLMGLAAWPFFLVAQLMLGGTQVITTGPLQFILALSGLVLLLTAVVSAVMGTGLAVAALRARGVHMILAASGLLIGGLFLGVFLGNYLIELWIL